MEEPTESAYHKETLCSFPPASWQSWLPSPFLPCGNVYEDGASVTDFAVPLSGNMQLWFE